MRRALQPGIVWLVAAAGCASAWQPVAVDTLSNASTQALGRVVVVTRDGYQRDLRNATLTRDSLIAEQPDSAGQRVAIPNADIVRLEQFDVSRNVLAETGSFIKDVLAEAGKFTVQFIACIFIRRSC